MTAPGRFLERWSRLKRQGDVAATGATAAPALAPSNPPQPAGAPPSEAAPVAPVPESALPPLESLNLEADFSGFLKKEVSESLRRAALRKLFSDPHFNRMDGLDIYIDDYSVSDPIPADMMKRLRQFDTFLKDADEAKPADAAATVIDGAPQPGANPASIAATPETAGSVDAVAADAENVSVVAAVTASAPLTDDPMRHFGSTETNCYSRPKKGPNSAEN